MHVLGKISWVVKPIERLGTTEQNFPIFFGAAVADIPTSFSKIETVPK